jgi:hypothetical protein
MTNIDAVTGEIVERLPDLPPAIAKAIIAVMKAAGSKQLGFDERNQHGSYSYVSIDKFLAAFGPLLADAGLIVLVDESSIEVRPGQKETPWLFPRYDVWLAHESGVMWGPLRRHLALPMTGPQTFGSAESYVQKRLLRGLFMVPTGDKDADDIAPDTGARPRPEATVGSTSGRAGAVPFNPSNEMRDIRVAVFKRIHKAIISASTIADLNRTGATGISNQIAMDDLKVYSLDGWQKLMDEDSERRVQLALPDDPVDDLGRPTAGEMA